jgi:hypothetical protein
MASLSMQFLTALGIDDEKGQLICERHKEVLTEIKTERDKYKEEAEKLPEIQKQLDQYKEAEKKGEKDPYKAKYEALKEDFNEYKKGVEAKETTAKKEAAYSKLLKEAGVSEKHIAKILKVSDIDSLELDEEGNVKEADKHIESIKSEWSDFIQTNRTEGAKVANPPTNNTGKAVKTKEEILKIKNTSERQEAWKDFILANQQKGN